MALRLLLIAAVLALAPGCGLLGGARPGDGTVVEFERCTLTDGKVVPLAGAGGGKAVLLGYDGQAETTLPMLKKGRYELVVHGFAPSYDEDAFFVTAGDQFEARVFFPNINKLLATKPLTFKQEKDGPCKVTVVYAEDNVKLDRIVITPAKPAK